MMTSSCTSSRFRPRLVHTTNTRPFATYLAINALARDIGMFEQLLALVKTLTRCQGSLTMQVEDQTMSDILECSMDKYHFI